jgi:hypothetical protein
MKKYKQAALSIAFLTFMLSGELTAGNINTNQQEEMILYSFENDDYNSWKKYIPKKSKIQKIINKDDFEKFVSARKLARAGEYEKAIQLSNDLEDKVKQNLITTFM